METITNILDTILSLAKVGLGLSVTYLCFILVSWVRDELKESRWDRSHELARTSNLETYFHALATTDANHKPAHRRTNANASSGRHRFDPNKPVKTYLERMREETLTKVLPAGDNIWSALLDEQRELQPAFAH